MTDKTTLITEIAQAENHLTQLRARRDELIKEGYQQGVSKYRLAKDWELNENTISRIVTGIKPGKRASAPPRAAPVEQEEEFFEKFYREHPDFEVRPLED